MYLAIIDDLEKVQKRATKTLRQYRHLNCRKRLEFLNLPRRNGGDMKQSYFHNENENN